MMFSQPASVRSQWTPWVAAIAGFWLSANLVLDCLVMPVMYVSGMATQTSFAPAGYTLFWSFNRIELLCAAAILTGVLALRRQPGEFEVPHRTSRCRWALALGSLLISLVLVDTYVLTPEMSAAAFALEATPTVFTSSMTWMHLTYWGLEVLKVLSLGGLGWLCLKDVLDLDSAAADASV